MMDHSNTNKYCAVPLCQNTSISTPQKLFVHAPLDVKRRNLWLRVAKLNPKGLVGSSKIYFCEDHFDLKNDMVNYSQYEMGISKTIELVPGCIPTKFKCHINDNTTTKSRNIQVPTIKKSLLDLTQEQKKQADTDTSATKSITELNPADLKSNNIQAQKSDTGLSENMDEFKKVFSSNITRSDYIQSNNLYDLLKIVPASPVEVNKPQSTTCDFTPNTDKYYIPKKKSMRKVRTVRGIRKEIEQDIYNYLPKALENQKATLLKKIMYGSARGETTQVMAQKVLKSDHPILRSSWQMLMNINPNKHQHSKQFVLWNGKCIQVNGSRGGKNKFICNYDLGNPRVQHFSAKKKISNKKKGLLQNSLSVKFKPGPLRWKKYLDDSHQKYHVGVTELISLPKAGLDIQPFYGMTLESGIAKFVNSLREENGRISGTWAEFAVTMLGSIKKSNAVQNNPDTIINFNLNYKCDQQKILMRRDIQEIQNSQNVQNEDCFTLSPVSNDSTISSEIQYMMEKMLDSVEMSLEQENMYSGEDEPRYSDCDGPINVNITKEKAKKRCWELDRLDVTVIRLPEDNQKNEQECNKSFCTLGCVCESLECSYNLKTHCGFLGCMFQCTCDFSRYMDTNILKSGCSDFIPGLLNLNTEMNLKLAKEEQKFRQTVIVSGEKSILLKRQKRNWKASKKYGDFYTNLNLKTNKKTELVLSVVDLNLNCQDIEPWCMVHNLYKCFCKGRFTETSISEFNEDNSQNIVAVEDILTKAPGANDNAAISTFIDESVSMETNSQINKTDLPSFSNHQARNSCARVKAYKGRKYTNSYYKSTNSKIRKMEQDDVKLKKRIMFLLNNNEIDSKTDSQTKSTIDSAAVVDVESSTCDNMTPHDQNPSMSEKNTVESVNKSKLVAWLESSYKLYKQRMSKGITKTSLEPPVLGKLALYTWEFILKRYKQRKNFFMVTKKAPFRIFIAVDGKSSFFENCININDIELADLHKFPVTVKNLLTSACDSQEDFCILCGWSDCWEIIGSVSKLNDKCKTSMVNENVFTSKDIFPAKTLLTEIDLLSDKNKSSTNIQSTVNLKRHSSSESSKWFVMTVENDFNEIQFHTRGFFVTYSSIIKAINVARGTGKTVRLSSQKCAEKGSGPQFGIYAIPDAKEYCVFVGPYEMHEHLGIETVINSMYVRKDKKTRGVWITTDKVDNGKVIDNPLSYMPLFHMDSDDMVDLESNNDSASNISTEYLDSSFDQTNLHQIDTSSEDSDVTKTPTKSIKPIKIRKTQNFYHIASNGALKKIFFKTKQEEPNIPPSFLSPLDNNIKKISDIVIQSSSPEPKKECHSPSKTLDDDINVDEGFGESTNRKTSGVEKTSQVKLTAVYSAKHKKSKKESKKPERGMFILKPEEINQKLLQKRLDETMSKKSQNDICEEKHLINMDIENFLANSLVCKSPEDEILEISDDSDDENLDQIMTEQNYMEVWIQCTNIDSFGWIRGRRNCDNLISFEFPGFKHTDFYETQEAFTKINQVLSRKIYIPKNFTLEWEVVQTERELKNKDMLDVEKLGPDFVLTKQGIRHKQDLLKGKFSQLKGQVKTCPTDYTGKNVPKCSPSTSKISDMTALEGQSVTLEMENDSLWNETLTNKVKILQSLREASEKTKQDMTEKLKTLMAMTE